MREFGIIRIQYINKGGGINTYMKMKKERKKLIMVVVLIFLITLCIPVTLFAADDNTTKGKKFDLEKYSSKATKMFGLKTINQTVSSKFARLFSKDKFVSKDTVNIDEKQKNRANKWIFRYDKLIKVRSNMTNETYVFFNTPSTGIYAIPFKGIRDRDIFNKTVIVK